MVVYSPDKLCPACPELFNSTAHEQGGHGRGWRADLAQVRAGLPVTSFSSCSAGDSVREWRGASAFCLHGLVVANPLLLHDQLAAHRLRAPRQGPCPLSLTLVSLHLDQTSSRAVPAIACAASILRSSLGPCRERPRRMVGRA